MGIVIFRTLSINDCKITDLLKNDYSAKAITLTSTAYFFYTKKYSYCDKRIYGNNKSSKFLFRESSCSLL